MKKRILILSLLLLNLSAFAFVERTPESLNQHIERSNFGTVNYILAFSQTSDLVNKKYKGVSPFEKALMVYREKSKKKKFARDYVDLYSAQKILGNLLRRHELVIEKSVMKKYEKEILSIALKEGLSEIHMDSHSKLKKAGVAKSKIYSKPRNENEKSNLNNSPFSFFGGSSTFSY